MSPPLSPPEDGRNGEREAPFLRDHWTYEQDHWETVHIDNVDQIGAFESGPMVDGHGRDPEATVRIDLDGFGHGGASMHDVDENLQCSVFLTPDRARELYEQLGEKLFELF